MIKKNLKYSTIATTPCTLSDSTAPAVWLHGLSLHNCGTSTRCCNHILISIQKEMLVVILYMLHTPIHMYTLVSIQTYREKNSVYEAIK